MYFSLKLIIYTRKICEEYIGQTNTNLLRELHEFSEKECPFNVLKAPGARILRFGIQVGVCKAGNQIYSTTCCHSVCKCFSFSEQIYSIRLSILI